MSHTPAPWRITSHGFIETHDGYRWITHPTYPTRQGDSEHIVLCVNAHEAFVTVAQKLVSGNYDDLDVAAARNLLRSVGADV